MDKTIKQIKNLKAYKEGAWVNIWTAALENENWRWGWYDLEVFEKYQEDFFHNTLDKFEYKIIPFS